MRSNLLPVAQPGFKYLGSALLASIVFSIFDLEFLAFISFILIIAFAFIYRNPEREVLSFEKESLLSPVDGEVISIEDIQDSEYAYKLEIDSSYLDVGVLRTPFDSSVETLDVKKGARLAKESHLSQDLNENVEITFVDTNSNRVKIRHELNRSFDEINIDVMAKESLKQASRYGFISNATTTIYLPQNFRVNVAVGSELKGSETLIGYFS